MNHKTMKFRTMYIVLILLFLMLALFLTHSMYVEWLELILIVIATTAFSVIMTQSDAPNGDTIMWLIKTAMIGFIGILVFTSADLVLDHYYVIQGVPDGKFLTLNETFGEFREVQFMIVNFGTAVVLLASAMISGRFHRH